MERGQLEEQAARLISDARACLLSGRIAGAVAPAILFFAGPAMRLKCVPDWTVRTMATDGRLLLYNPAFTCGLTRAQVLGVVVHETLHCCLLHFARLEGRNQAKANVAMDLSINWIIREAKIELPPCRLMPGEGEFTNLPGGQSFEWYYERLPDNPGGEDGLIGDVIPAPSDGDGEGGSAALEGAWKVATAAAAELAKSRGSLPGTLARLVGETLDPPLPWRTILRDFVSRTARNDFSWSRANRRFIGAGLYLPGMHSEELGEIVVAIDVSGSISNDTLAAFANELNGILDAHECTTRVIYADAAVSRVETWCSDDRPVVLTACGGGGTNHNPVFAKVEEEGWDVSCIVCLTDGHTHVSCPPPDAPVLWVITPGGTTRGLPWGKFVMMG